MEGTPKKVSSDDSRTRRARLGSGTPEHAAHGRPKGGSRGVGQLGGEPISIQTTRFWATIPSEQEQIELQALGQARSRSRAGLSQGEATSWSSQAYRSDDGKAGADKTPEVHLLPHIPPFSLPLHSARTSALPHQLVKSFHASHPKLVGPWHCNTIEHLAHGGGRARKRGERASRMSSRPGSGEGGAGGASGFAHPRRSSSSLVLVPAYQVSHTRAA